jgi:hypothetical protein
MGSDRAAEALIDELGITTPGDIDLDAIAFTQGVEVRRGHLTGCDAFLVGHGDRAVMTVNRRGLPERQRFSIAHELGHWHHHRGQGLYCLSGDIESNRPAARESERVADNYASSLLMPAALFSPLAYASAPTWKHVRTIAKSFACSLSATARRLAELSPTPLVFVVSQQGRRQWFQRSEAAAAMGWFPREDLDSDTHAFELSLREANTPGRPVRVRARAWFEGSAFDGGAEVLEESIRIQEVAYTLISPLGHKRA